MNEYLAPLVLFVYNRPHHTQRVLEALEKNELAQDTILYIYADGGKKNATKKQLAQIEDVRKIIRKEWKFKEINIVERQKNWGLADNIIDGVNKIIYQYGKIIVLEDDIITAKGFLKYMNDALELYQEEEKVMHISGYIPPLGEDLPETYFYNQTSCWGWATWQRAWQLLNQDALYLLNAIQDADRLFEFNLEGSYPFSEHLIANIHQKVKTWAIKWHASVFLQRGLCLHPAYSMTENIGNDNSGTNSVRSKMYDIKNLKSYTSVMKIPLEENLSVRKRMIDFNRRVGWSAKPMSPLVKNNLNNIKLIRSLDTDKIIKDYQKNFQVDVRRFFEGIPTIKVYQCLESGYQFYYPFHTKGDGQFYAQMQRYEWYYMPWKWEHEQASKWIKPAMKVLEIGCGKGDFLQEIKKRHQVATLGLELNRSASQEATKKGINILNESIETHTMQNTEQYDVICSFEVLEHIPEVSRFLESAIKCLKKGGKLLIAVPNNESFIKYFPDDNTLNMPPHHLGLWSATSLKNITQYFPLYLEKILFEPIQAYHKTWYEYVMRQRFQKMMPAHWYAEENKKQPNFFKKIFRYLGVGLLKCLSSRKGHTVLAVYVKK